MTKHPALGRIGIWSFELSFGDAAKARDDAAELESLGFGGLWLPGGIGGDVLERVTVLLGATQRTTIATGILNIWKHQPADVVRWWQDTSDQARVLLGLGVSHGPAIGANYGKPLTVMRNFLDGLEAAGGVSPQHLCLAALGPKMLDLARERTAGAHPYLVTPEHTAIAREHVGPDALVAAEQAVILETDPSKARAIAAEAISVYLGLPNYVSNWRRLGFSEEDVTKPSERLLDALFAWGTVDQIGQRVKAHLDAGADHVCLQVAKGPVDLAAPSPMKEWRELAALLG